MPTLGTNTTTLNRFPAGASTTRKGKKKKKKTQSEKTSETLVSSNSGCLPGGAQLTHAGSREAREMLGLGTQALKPWGLKHQAADNDVLYQSLFSKPITEVGAQEKWLYHPCLSGRSPFLVSQSPRTQTGNAPRTAANVMHKAMQFKKLCISVERWSPRRRILIASINQSIYWHIKPTSTKCWELQSCIKYIRKLVICHLSSVKTNDKCAQSFRFAVVVIGNFYKISERKKLIFHIFCPVTNKVRPPSPREII